VSYTIGFDHPRPREGVRVDHYTPWLRDRVDVVAAKAHNIGLVYFGHKQGKDWEPFSSATFFILNHNGKRVGVTALHAIVGKGKIKKTRGEGRRGEEM
jgi:hypothetical protein